MKSKLDLTIHMIMLLIFFCSCSQQKDDYVITGDYLGEEPPGEEAKLFAPAIVSTNMNEDGGPIFTPDGKEIFWRIGMAPFSVFVYMKQDNGIWSKPEIAPFSGSYSDGGLSISPDGMKIFFTSKRPFEGSEGLSKFHTWMTEKLNGNWQAPVPMGQPIDHPDDYYTRLSVPSDGTLIKQSGIAGGMGGWDLYESKFIDGKYSEPVILNGAVNTEFNEYGPTISPDGSYIVFQSDNRPDTTGSIDLYITFKLKNNNWSRGIHLGENINTVFMEHWPSLTPDGKYLFFSSNRPVEKEYGYSKQRKNLNEIKALHEFYYLPKYGGDIYWISTIFIENLKPED
ncbi:TolB family protein [Bacteroidota bacterium]